jgi:cellobiose transport system permease protein
MEQVYEELMMENIQSNLINTRVKKKKIPFRLSSFLKYTILILAGLAFLLPFYWMVVSSFRPLGEFYKIPLPLIPLHPTVENYLKLFQRSLFLRGILNSLFLAIISVLTQVFFCALAGYSFAKMKFKGRDVLFIGVLATMMLPGSVTLVPNFIIMARLHWIDTYTPLIVLGIANAFGIFWMRQYCESIPNDLLDAAKIDGAGEFTIFWQIVMPIIKPALASLAIFVFLSSWTDFQGPLVFLRSDVNYTVQLWLSYVSRQSDVFQPHLVMAGSVLASIPVILLFATLQRYFIAGLTAGSLK